jgi:AcrR family transcriptional regulator
MLREALAERTTDRRSELLEAAVTVFARKGFHAARVGDIAEEAGVAHGLLYHYFRSKDEVLDTIFRDTWDLLETDTKRVEAADVPLREQLRRFARMYLGSWLLTPDLVRVLVREVARSADVGDRVGQIRGTLSSLERMIEAAQQRNEVRADCDATFATWAVYGALEEILTGWVLGQLPAGEEDVDRAAASVVDVAWAGLAA